MRTINQITLYRAQIDEEVGAFSLMRGKPKKLSISWVVRIGRRRDGVGRRIFFTYLVILREMTHSKYGMNCQLSSAFRDIRFFFYSIEDNPREPVHVHALSRDGEAIFWLKPFSCGRISASGPN